MKTFPVTESTLSAAALVRHLIDLYNLSSTTTCKLFRTGMNHLYFITDGDNRFVLRVYNLNWRTLTEINEEVRLLLHLRKHGVPVSAPVQGLDGEYVFSVEAPEGRRFMVLFTFAEGKKEPRFSPQTSFRMGVMLGKIHQLTENFSIARVHYTPKELLENSILRCRSFFSPDLEDMVFIERASDHVFRQLSIADTKMIRFGAVHLDCWFDNMHITADEITLFDFDFCGNGWLCYDVAYFLFQLKATNLTEQDYQDKAEQFLAGYESILKLTDEEKRMIPYAGLAVLLFYLGVQCDRFDTWSNIFLNEDHLKRFAAGLRRWMDYHQLSFSADLPG